MEKLDSDYLLQLNIHKSWHKDLLPIMNHPDSLKIFDTLIEQRKAGKKITPGGKLMFSAFETRRDTVRAIILGQDPYPDSNMAIGKAFLIPEKETKVPYSLKIITSALREEYLDYPELNAQDLSRLWPCMGVLCLNTAFTLADDTPESHLELWKPFTEKIIDLLAKDSKIVWMIWGKKALSFVEGKDIKMFYTNHPASVRYGNEFKPNFKEAAEYLKDESFWVLPF